MTRVIVQAFEINMNSLIDLFSAAALGAVAAKIDSSLPVSTGDVERGKENSIVRSIGAGVRGAGKGESVLAVNIAGVWNYHE